MGGFYSAKFAFPEPRSAPSGQRAEEQGRSCALDAAPGPWDEEGVIIERADGVELRIWAKPRGSRTRVTGIRKGPDGLDLLEVALGAPPVDGAANAELLEFLARQLKVPKRSVVLSRGASSREKVVQILGVDRNQVVASLGL
ncbi:MAG: hypothetical protein B6A08_18265 [Sorangiineae bacterium NIC37A_2]|nr:MAG: hypothetical protein B6A08_18265 [Sorangiineae bacterium NIC37A_2]